MARWTQEQRAEARQRILEAARDVFSRCGFEGATMRHIAAMADLAVGTLFNYFPDKRELLFAALHDDLEHVSRRCAETLPEPGAAFDDLCVHIAGSFYDYYVQRPELSRALLKESLWATGEAGAAFQAQVAGIGKVLGGRVAALQASGALRRDAVPDQIVLAFFSHYYFVLLLELRGSPNRERMGALIRILAQQLVAGVGMGAGQPSEVADGP